MVMAKSNSTLIVRHLPKELSASKQEELLKHFGAVEVKCMGMCGKMKHSAFARFPSSESAKSALQRLHQREILGRLLHVEYADEFNSPVELVKVIESGSQISKPLVNNTKLKESFSQLKEQLCNVSPQLNVPHQPFLKYVYPPPTPSIVNNIANMIATVPKLYVQVLHLMNKMNLPPPFGEKIIPIPPLHDESCDIPLPGGSDEEVEMEENSSEESEMESDTETPKSVVEPAVVPLKIGVKRKVRIQQGGVAKKITLKRSKLQTSAAMNPQEVFENAGSNETFKKSSISLKIATSLPSSDLNAIIAIDIVNGPATQSEVEGFGRYDPSESDISETPVAVSDPAATESEATFISLKELTDGTIKPNDMQMFPVFKTYVSGDPSERLYVKNVSKTVTAEDLKYIYGRYVEWSSEEQKSLFDIRLMTEGRMKGQAFVTLPTVKQAVEALNQTNGFMLKGKPIVVMFAKAARAKPV